MFPISGIRAALAGQIAAQIPGLRTVATVPGQISPPTAVVRPARGTFITYGQTMGDNAADLTFDVIVLTASGSDRSGQTELDSYLSPDGPQSIWAAIRTDPSLGGAVSYAYLDRASGYGLMSYGGVEYLAATLSVICGAP
jgi:hypothetical protein